MLRFFLIIAFIASAGFSSAQSPRKDSPDALKKLKKIEEAVTSGDWNQARTLSEKLVKQFPDWPDGWKIYAEAWLGEGYSTKSESALRKLVQLDSVSYPDAYRWLAAWTSTKC